MIKFESKVGVTCANENHVELTPGGSTSCVNCTCTTCCY